MRKHTLVIEGGQLGAVIALALAGKAGLKAERKAFRMRRDGTVQVWAYGTEENRVGRKAWVAACKRAGLSVAPAPWERKGEKS